MACCYRPSSAFVCRCAGLSHPCIDGLTDRDAPFPQQSGVYQIISRKMIFGENSALCGKTIRYAKFVLKFCTETFKAMPINVLCAKFVKFRRWEFGEVMRYLPVKETKFSLAVQVLLLLGTRVNWAAERSRCLPQSALFRAPRTFHKKTATAFGN